MPEMDGLDTTREIRRIAARHGTPIVAVVFDLPEAIVRARNAGRMGRSVPDEVVTRHLATLARARTLGTLEAEGYAMIVRLPTPTEVDETMIRVGR